MLICLSILAAWPSHGRASWTSATAFQTRSTFTTIGWAIPAIRRASKAFPIQSYRLLWTHQKTVSNVMYAGIDLIWFLLSLFWCRIIPVNLKQTITCTAIAYGGDAEWDFAFQQYRDTNVAAESTKLLYGMSCSQDPETLTKFARTLSPFWSCFDVLPQQLCLCVHRFLEMSLDPTSGIRRSDASSVFRNVASNRLGRDIAFDFLRSRWTEMVAL